MATRIQHKVLSLDHLKVLETSVAAQQMNTISDAGIPQECQFPVQAALLAI